LSKEQGMTQAELARAIGVSQQTVFAYELGDRRVSVLLVAKLAKVFGVSVEELMGMTRSPRPANPRLLRKCGMPSGCNSSAKPNSTS
jgi:transcriptional regulator with XRE-family HTH domain